MENIYDGQGNAKEQLGLLLKEGREKNSLTIEDVADSLKANRQTVISIENGELIDDISAFYVRQIVRRYVNLVNIGSVGVDELVDTAYMNKQEELARTISINPTGMTFEEDIKTKKRKDSVKKNSKAIASFLLLGIIIISLLFFLSKNISSSIKESENDSKLVEDTVLKPEEVIKPVVTTTIDFKNSKGFQHFFEINGLETKEYDLRIELDGPCYVGVWDTKTAKKIGTPKVFNNGQKFEAKIKNINDVTINLGAANKAKIFVNDIQVDIESKNLAGKNHIMLKMK